MEMQSRRRPTKQVAQRGVMRHKGYAERKGVWYVEEKYEDKIRKVKLTHWILETIAGVIIGLAVIACIAIIYNGLIWLMR